MTLSAADRQRRRRERIRLGVTRITLELPFEDIDQLIERGDLAAWDDGDPKAIAEAILRLIRAPMSRVTGRGWPRG